MPFTIVVTFLALSTVGAPDVTVYGASWCGPCETVKSFLTTQRVAFELIDIDEGANGERFAKVSPDSGAIPLVVIGQDRVRGARLTAIKTLLVQRKLMQPVADDPGKGERYGSYTAAEWQQQFQLMRQRVTSQKERLAKLEKEVVDVEGRAQILPKARRDVKIANDSLDDLEKAASDVSLPRQYRAY